MQDAFLTHVNNYDSWKDSEFLGVKSETKEFIENVLKPNKKYKMWNHQIEGLLRTIYAFEVLGKKNCLLNIITKNGKTTIIKTVIF